MNLPGRCRRICHAAGLLAFMLAGHASLAAELPGAVRFRKDVQPILQQYCFDCHADGANKGGVAFDEFKSDRAMLDNHDLWMNVMKYLRAGIMPPEKKPHPTAGEQARIAEWIKTAAFGIDPANPDPGRVTVRRLNRIEYRNTIRDLMGIDFNSEVEFPADDTGYGFDDIGDVLTLSPMLMEKYVTAANSIVEQAVPTVGQVIPETTIAGSQFRSTNSNRGDNRPNQRRDTMLSFPYDKSAAVVHTFEAQHAGSYHFTLELAIRGDFDYDAAKCRAKFTLDGRELLGKEFGWENNKTLRFEYDEKLTQGGHPMFLTVNPAVAGDQGSNTLSLRLVGVTVRGPMEKEYWTRPKNYDRFFGKNPPESPAARRQLAGELLSGFATKAFRRPVDDKTVERLTKLAEGVYAQRGKTFEAGVAHAMVAVLASPRFLFRMEQSAPGTATAAWSPVDEYSLASRLSYFLWSTMPDAELLRLAQVGELRKNLPGQVKRMLGDSRSEAMVQNFVGQWLQVRDVDGAAIDARAVFVRDSGQEKQLRERLAAFRAQRPPAMTNAPGQTNQLAQGNGQRRLGGGGFRNLFKPRFELDGELRQDMKSETEMYFAGIVHEDRSVTELIDSDYTFLNEKLANVYGLTNLNILGSEMRRVTLPPDCPRGGVLTHGSMLVVTSNPDRTSPVKRGLFVLDNILGMPAPPPPPNIPALEAADKTFTDHDPTLRESLEVHRNKPLCASCHSRMDPIGLGMENFNALGAWRDKERGQTIEPGGKLATGETFNNVRELKHILANDHRTEFYRCLTEKLLTYALGRGPEYYDVETVDKIVNQLEKNDGHFSTLLTGIIESAPFQEQRNHANATFSEFSEPQPATSAGQMAGKPSAP